MCFIALGIEHDVCVGRHSCLGRIVFTSQEPRRVAPGYDVAKQDLSMTVDNRRGAYMKSAITVA